MASVVVDDREPDWIAKQLESLGLTVGRTRLDAGDYAFYPHGLRVGIERKTMSNLLGSLSSHQLVGQAHKMVTAYDISVLQRVGSWRRGIRGSVEYVDPRDPRADDSGWVRTEWAWSSFNGMMRDLSLMGIHIWDCPVQGGEAEDIASIVASLSQEEHRWLRSRQRPAVLTNDTQHRNVVWALCAFDGIGPETATNLLRGRSFASVIRAAEIAPLTLTEVKGFGKKRAERLNEEVTQSYAL